MDERQEHLARVDRDTLVPLLAQRQDLSEQDANRIIDQVNQVQHEILHQAQQVKDRVQGTIQSTVDDLLTRLQDHLNAMERPELNYEAIKRDIHTLFEDPKTGFEALSRCLDQFDRDTLIAILSTCTDISEEQAGRVINQIEVTRDSVLNQVNRLQAEIERCVNALRHEAKAQADEIRKAVATAAWWLFGMAVTSVATAVSQASW